MEIDKRVLRLEEDVNILKNQIRNTLLELQEQLAASYHPSLRPPRAAPAPDSAPEALDVETEEEPAPRPRVRRVSLSQARQAASPAPASPAGSEGSEDLTMVTALLRWANESVAKVGPAHTRGVLETYVADGRISASLAQSVAQLASLNTTEAGTWEASIQDVLDVLAALNHVMATCQTDGDSPEGPRRG